MPVLLSLKSRFLWKLIVAFFAVAFFALAISYFYLVPSGASIWVAAAVAVFFSGLTGFFVARSFSRSISEILEMLHAVAEGNFALHFRRRSHDEFDGIALQITLMTRKLKLQFSALAAERLRLETILDSMVEGVVVTGARAEVLLVNKASVGILEIAPDYHGRRFIECCRNTDLQDVIETVLATGKTVERGISLWTLSQERHLMVHAAPLAREGDETGCVAVMHDVTRLRKLEEHRKEFVANVSHELKTPLTSIRGYAETLQSGAMTDPEAGARFVEKILKNASQLQNLVDDILELSTIESGRTAIRKEEVSLEKLLDAFVRDQQQALQAKNITLTVEVEGVPPISADPKSLGQILRNLLDNAVKYTPDGGSVTVTAKRNPQDTTIDVQDTGIGIPERDQPRVFERFFRVDQSRSREIGGTGLGLAIVKHLVQASGWSIRLQSRVNSGTRFTVVIPHSKDLL